MRPGYLIDERIRHHFVAENLSHSSKPLLKVRTVEVIFAKRRRSGSGLPAVDG
jgi:hypothetical protein